MTTPPSSPAPGSVRPLVSVVVPVCNEEASLPRLFEAIASAFEGSGCDWEAIVVDDGSTDASATVIEELVRKDPRVRCLSLSRNFGKEIALTAGIREAAGDAVICLDADLQHPPRLIPAFIAKWRAGAEVVVGVRNASKSDSFLKRLGSVAFYRVMGAISETEILVNATDFRLLDRAVVDELNRFTERNRITRGLIDWLGFRRELVPFDADERARGEAAYGLRKLVGAAISGLVANSLFPLRLAAYLGVLIVCCSSLLGIVMLLDRYADWGLHFSGPAILADIILFLIGIVLVCLGLLAFYIAHIHRETQNRPLYVVRRKRPADRHASR